MKSAAISFISLYKKISTAFRETRIPLFIYTDCKHYPSCSDYAIKAINKHGIAKGSLKSLRRILKCSPLSKGGLDLP